MSCRRAFAAGLILFGCAPSLRHLGGQRVLDTKIGQFNIEYSPGTEADRARIERAVETAAPLLSRWGVLRDPVRVYVLKDHAELEAAVDRNGYDWLRAWGRYDEVLIQAPSTWGLFGPTQLEVNELVLHELTHCLMYQLAGDRWSWRRKEIPLWFREGMASHVAGQEYRRASLEELARFYARHPREDPLKASESLYRDQSGMVYAAAHHAFEFLVNRYGEGAVCALLQRMRDGERFERAFEQAVGVPLGAFEKDFERYVKWRGFRRSAGYRSAFFNAE